MTEYEKWIEERGIQRSDMGLFGSGGYYWYGKDLMELGLEDIRAFGKDSYRDQAVQLFGFAILTEEVVKALLPLGPFLEIGAGSGYWAYELAKAGADIIAIDPHPFQGLKHRCTKEWYPVERVNAHKAIGKYGEGRTLLTVWPSYKENWPADAIKQYMKQGGTKVIYEGEWGGCTADDKFHTLLTDYWTEVEEIRIPQWDMIHDRLWVLERKQGE